MSDVDGLKRDIVFQTTLRDRPMTFHSTWGLFSPRRIDDGSRMLIEKIPVEEGDLTLDLGCGYGPIGLSLAAADPRGTVHLVDKDFVALDYVHRNAEANGIANVEVYASNAFSAVPEGVQFDNVVSNLPANVGKEMLSIILHDARARLKPGGRLCVVTVAGLRRFIRRNFEEVFGNYAKLKQGKTYAVALAVRE